MMDTKKKGIQFTVQGVDPPVPVGEGGARIGPPRPSSDDYPAPLVMHQAEVQVCATDRQLNQMEVGTEVNEPDPFKRSRKVGRSPMKPPRSGSMSSERGRDRKLGDPIILDDSPDQGNAKRKRSEETRVAKREEMRDKGIVEKLLEELALEIGKLQKLVGDQSNTHKKIKEQTQKLGRMAEYAQSEKILRWFKDQWAPEDVERKVGDLRLENERLKSMKDPEKVDKLRKENAELRKIIQGLKTAKEQIVGEEMFVEDISFKEFKKLENMEWPETTYKVAFFAAGSPLTTRKETDHLVIHEEGAYQNKNEGIRKTYCDRFPELREMEGEIGAIKVITNIVTKTGEDISSEKWIIRTEVGDNKEDLFRSLLMVKEMMVGGGRKKLSVYPPGYNEDGKDTRKMLEYVFRRTNIKCLLHVKKSTKERPTKESGRGRVAQRNDALVLTQTGKTYADLLRVIKEKVRPDSVEAKAIKTIRESREGKMVIVLNKGEDAAVERLEKEIVNLELNKSKRNGENREGTVYIQDIDSMVSKEEVSEAVCRETGLNPEQLTIGEFRKSYGGNRAVTLRLPRQMAEELNSRRNLRIGLNMCPVRERVDVIRCFRCWRFGHIAKDCKDETDSSGLCKKCSGSGHHAVNCDRRDWCLTCKVGGHTTGSGLCPEFRKAIARGRKMNKKKRVY